MKKALIIPIILLAMFSLVSCSKKEVKQVTDDSKTAQEAIIVSEAIKDAYLKRNLMDIEKNATKEGYREVLGAMKSFDKAELTFMPKWIDMDKTSVSLKIAWNGTWVVKDQTTEERGLAIFVFEGRPLKLTRILRANPFRQPE